MREVSKGRGDVAIAVKLDDLLHDRRMTLTELADRVDITGQSLDPRPARRAQDSTADAAIGRKSVRNISLVLFSDALALLSTIR
jgi:hypothetical protein